MSEAAWQEGAEGLEGVGEADQAEERARVLATEALPHHGEAAVKALFAAEGLPVPPISGWIADGSA